MNYQQHLANSAAIRAEIQRFESVHPNIYSIYELLERVEEPLLQNQIREHVIAIEGKILRIIMDIYPSIHLTITPVSDLRNSRRMFSVEHPHVT